MIKNMNLLIENYLKELVTSDLSKLLNKSEEVIAYSSEKDIELGLLRYDKPPINKVFLFKFNGEKIRYFHTIGMKFNIDILFFDYNGKLVNSYKNVKPGVKVISSKKPSTFVVEIPK